MTTPHQQGIVILQFSVQISQRRIGIGGIENQIALAITGGNHDTVEVGSDVRRQFDAEDGMVKRKTREVRLGNSAIGVDEYIVGFDTHLVEHAAQQCSFVLTIAIASSKNIRGQVWLKAANPDFN